MKKIAIFVSNAGEAAERLIRLFNEGNRVNTVVLAADESAKDILERINDPNVLKFHVPDAEWKAAQGELARILTQREVDLLVLDNFGLLVSSEVMESVDGRVLSVTSAEKAPREVVDVLEAELRKPQEPEKEEEEQVMEIDENPTPESEWAKSLNIQFTPPTIPKTPPAPPMAASSDAERRDNGNPNFDTHFPENSSVSYPEYPQYPKEPYPHYHHRHTPHHHEEGNEPMPSTWMIWSILVTIFCCFIPGIVAIIFSSQVSTRYFAGDLEGAKRSSRMAEIWIIVSFVVGVLAATLYVPFVMAGIW